MRTSNSTLVEELRESLSKHIVKFSYRKADGSVRDAIGTRNLALVFKSTGVTIPAPKTGRENPNAYFDIEKMGWRSFIPSNVIMMNCGFLDNAKFGESVGEPTPKDGILVSDEEILNAMDEIDKDIEIPIGGVGGGVGGGMGSGIGGGVGGGMGIGMGGGKPTDKGNGPKSFDLGKVAGMLGVGIPKGGGMGMPPKSPEERVGGAVGKPTDVGYGMALPISGVANGKEMTIDDFAKLVAKYVVAELASRLCK